MIKANLSDISKPIEKELVEFNKLFSKSMKSDVALVDLVTKYILKQKGKKIRPQLVLLSSKLISSNVTDRTYRGAILVELLHTATLIHDDVVDSADKRRGLPSINAVWKNKVSVLMGDYLLSRGLTKAVEGSDFDFLKVITNTVKRMSEGELLQISKTRKLDITEDIYFKIIGDKTASLLSTCCEIGAMSATDDLDKVILLKEFGEYLGIAFQIRDDILDFVGTSIIGKPLGGDIKEKKMTLPLIHCLNKVSKKEADSIRKIVKKGGKNGGIKTVIEFVKDNGGIDFAEKTAIEFADKAKNCLNIFEPSESKTAFTTLIDYVVTRKK